MSTRRPRRCRALLLDISRYLDGELPPARRRSVEAHIDACDCCSEMSFRLRAVIAACRAEGAARPPRAVMTRAAARIRTLLSTGR
jgi:anti-sigma factor RsiW